MNSFVYNTLEFSEKITSFSFFEYCPMQLHYMSMLSVLCIMGKLH